jgi:hypothetical protein
VDDTQPTRAGVADTRAPQTREAWEMEMYGRALEQRPSLPYVGQRGPEMTRATAAHPYGYMPMSMYPEEFVPAQYSQYAPEPFTGPEPNSTQWDATAAYQGVRLV